MKIKGQQCKNDQKVTSSILVQLVSLHRQHKESTVPVAVDSNWSKIGVTSCEEFNGN